MASQTCGFLSPLGTMFSGHAMCPLLGFSHFHSLQESFLTLFPGLLADDIALRFWNIRSVKKKALTYCSGASTFTQSHKLSLPLHFYPTVMSGNFSHPITILMVYTIVNLQTSVMFSLLLNISP